MCSFSFLSCEPTRLFSFLFPDHTHVPDPPAPDPVTSHVEEDQNISERVYEPSEQERQLVTEREAVVESQSYAVETDASAMVESASSSALEDAPKKSYASIVSANLKIFCPRAFVL